MYNKTKLTNGINVITTHMPSVRSFAIGIYFKACSNYETGYTVGISHLIEHMMFKGTKNHTAKDIAEIIDNIGGSMNAYTSKDCTAYYAKVLYEHADIAIDLLADMLMHSTFDSEDLIKEIDVVKEEIALYEDSPEDVCYEAFQKLVYEGHALAEPVLGYANDLEGIKREEILDYMKAFYTVDNMVISVAGYLPDNLMEILERSFGNFETIGRRCELPDVEFKAGYVHTNKDIEQMHLCIGFESVPYDHEDHYATALVSNMFGGTSSSILYQKIREENGLTYSIYSHPTFFIDSGHFTIYTALQPKYSDKVVQLIAASIIELYSLFDPIKLKQAKMQLKGAYMLGLENSSSIMAMYGKRSIYGANLKSMDAIMTAIEAITIEQVNTVINKLFSRPCALSVVGRINEEDVKNMYQTFTSALSKGVTNENKNC